MGVTSLETEGGPGEMVEATRNRELRPTQEDLEAYWHLVSRDTNYKWRPGECEKSTGQQDWRAALPQLSSVEKMVPRLGLKKWVLWWDPRR